MNKFLGAVAAIGLFCVFMWFTGTYSVKGGNTVVVENTITGSMSVASGPKFGLKMPFFSNVHHYKNVSTLTFADEEAQTTRNLKPVTVKFADTYTALIDTSFRFRIPTEPTQMIKLHRDYRSFDNMVDSLFVKNARNTAVVTATQFTGEEFFQGGLNQYKSMLEDQMINGLFETRRVQVEVEASGLAEVSAENSDGNKIEVAKQLVWKTQPRLDANGNPIRQKNPLDQYGIEVNQITLADPQPDTQLDKLLKDKKALVGERIRTIQEQETARAQADTEQLKKEIERTKAVQDANREKELAVIAQKKEVEIERQKAIKETVVREKEKALAVINKQKELEIAQANEGIQKANAVAAKHEADAIRQKGLAEAEVTEAKYRALGNNKEIFMAEVERDIAKSLYTNLKDFTVEMPTNLISSDGETPTSNLDILTQYVGLDVMSKMTPANDNVAADQAVNQ